MSLSNWLQNILKIFIKQSQWLYVTQTSYLQEVDNRKHLKKGQAWYKFTRLTLQKKSIHLNWRNYFPLSSFISLTSGLKYLYGKRSTVLPIKFWLVYDPIPIFFIFFKAPQLFSSQFGWFHIFDQEYCTQLYMHNYENVKLRRFKLHAYGMDSSPSIMDSKSRRLINITVIPYGPKIA